MGYSTQFTGELLFKDEQTASQLAHLSTILGEDCRDHPDWDAAGLYHVDLELNDDFTGIRWSNNEKTYDLDKIVNVVTAQMRKRWPNFQLVGQMAAQGEDIEDRWALVLDGSGNASRQEIVVTGQRVTCPHCEESFLLEGALDARGEG